MAAKEINGKSIELDGDGYLADPSQWDEELAKALAQEIAIGELTDDHWKVITYVRKEHEAGTALTMRKVAKQSGVDMKGFYQLFPDGPLKKASYIAGIPKPKSCV
ncbi:MAG: TusE/DsrC/DsvC family sulfur relay protein [Candidatus Latescibacterota bacterium]